ncbi:MAG: hypothetical protein A3J69_02515 [Candidatus Levybacteria bacterium RIFCSPHIGHO2_02_FULL_42_12]|nr:MAG: hypothetical protein A3J69_02515 [Candidatus Levybacteria bacterium RIFCSPHIGHO2_02_FULL_42_12]
MTAKTFGLIAFLVILTSALLTFAVLQQKPTSQPAATTTQQNEGASPPSQTPIDTILRFSPAYAGLTSGKQGSLDVLIQTNTNEVTAVQLEVAFDPQKFTNVKIVEPSATAGAFLENPFVLLNKVDKQKGRISYAVGVPPTGNPKKGKGTVVSIMFTSRLSSGETASFVLLPETLVTASGTVSSVLKTTQNATITGL